MGVIENFEKMLAEGQDGPLLRYSLGTAYLQAGDPARAAEHLAQAVEQDEGYSAAWKAYGQAMAELGQVDEADRIYGHGIAVAEARGDKQAAKEMQVFRKRLHKPG